VIRSFFATATLFFYAWAAVAETSLVRFQNAMNGRSTKLFPSDSSSNVILQVEAGTEGELLASDPIGSRGNFAWQVRITSGSHAGRTAYFLYNPNQPMIERIAQPAASNPSPVQPPPPVVEAQPAPAAQPANPPSPQTLVQAGHSAYVRLKSTQVAVWIPDQDRHVRAHSKNLIYEADASREPFSDPILGKMVPILVRVNGEVVRGWVAESDLVLGQQVQPNTQSARIECESTLSTEEQRRIAMEMTRSVRPIVRRALAEGGPEADSPGSTHLTLQSVSERMSKIRSTLIGELSPQELTILKAQASRGNQNESALASIRNKIFRLIYSPALSDEDRELVAASWTAFGEARTITRGGQDTSSDPQSRGEMLGVLQTLTNRASAKNKTLIDMALQPMQFSMYNVRDPNWVKALLGPGHGATEQTHQRTYQAYIDWKSKKYRTSAVFQSQRMTHYYALGSSTPDWAADGRQIVDEELTIFVPPPPEGGTVVQPKLHVFFQGVRWSHRAPPWKG
jgi:hypothetical protein